jgi:universal stress protein A
MTRNVTRILVPTDFSEPSDAALEYATALAARLGASLHLLHVFEDPYLSGGSFAAEVYAPIPADLREDLLAEATNQLARTVATIDPAPFELTAEVYTGPASRAIAEYAQTHDIDLIVIGTHGRGGMAHLLLGSVAERIVRTAPCPVLTVRTATVAIPAATAAA